MAKFLATTAAPVDFRRTVFRLSVAYDKLRGRDELVHEVEFDDRIAQGNFGEVYRGVWKGKLVAIKSIKQADDGKKVEYDVLREADKMSDVRHPYVVTMLGVFS